jgi:hypothetical protein
MGLLELHIAAHACDKQGMWPHCGGLDVLVAQNLKGADFSPTRSITVSAKLKDLFVFAIVRRCGV